MRYNLCTWLGEISSCSCLTVLPGPAWLLLNKICIPSLRALYFYLLNIRPKATFKGLLECWQDFCHITQFLFCHIATRKSVHFQRCTISLPTNWTSFKLCLPTCASVRPHWSGLGTAFLWSGRCEQVKSIRLSVTVENGYCDYHLMTFIPVENGCCDYFAPVPN